MKKFIAIVVMMLFIVRSHGQSQEAQQLVLNYTKLQQLEAILDEMYRGYKILSKGYNTIKDISEGNFTIHDLFLNGLYKVNPTIRAYKRIPSIIQFQQFINKEYKRAYDRFRNDPNLTLREIKYLESVYAYLIKQTLRNIDELLTIITATKLRMSDEERIAAIDRIYYDMESKIVFLKVFNNNTNAVAIHRARQQREINTMRKLFNVTP